MIVSYVENSLNELVVSLELADAFEEVAADL